MVIISHYGSSDIRKEKGKGGERGEGKGGEGAEDKSQGERKYSENLSSGKDRTVTFMNSNQLWLPAYGFHKTGPMNIT